MNAPGVLLDTGPLVALLSRRDVNHARARRMFADCAPPLRSCEAVVAEACFLLRKLHRDAPAEALALADRGVFTIDLIAREHWPELRALVKRYSSRPVSFADACLIRCAEVHHEGRILTFDSDFGVYRWSGRKRFQLL